MNNMFVCKNSSDFNDIIALTDAYGIKKKYSNVLLGVSIIHNMDYEQLCDELGFIKYDEDGNYAFVDDTAKFLSGNMFSFHDDEARTTSFGVYDLKYYWPYAESVQNVVSTFLKEGIESRHGVIYFGPNHCFVNIQFDLYEVSPEKYEMTTIATMRSCNVVTNYKYDLLIVELFKREIIKQLHQENINVKTNGKTILNIANLHHFKEV